MVKLGMSCMVHMMACIGVNRRTEIIIVLSICVSDMLRYMIIMNEGIDFMSWCNKMGHLLVSWVNMMGLKLRMSERYDSKLRLDNSRYHRLVNSRCHRLVNSRCHIVLIHWGVRLSYWHRFVMYDYWHRFVMYDFVRLWILDYLMIDNRTVGVRVWMIKCALNGRLLWCDNRLVVRGLDNRLVIYGLDNDGLRFDNWLLLLRCGLMGDWLWFRSFMMNRLSFMLNSRFFRLNFWRLMNWFTHDIMATVVNSICVLMLIMLDLANSSLLIMSISVICTNGGWNRLSLFSSGRRRSGCPIAVTFVLNVAGVIIDGFAGDVGLGSAIISVVLYLLTMVG